MTYIGEVLEAVNNTLVINFLNVTENNWYEEMKKKPTIVNEIMQHLERLISKLTELYGEPVVFPSLGVATFSTFDELMRIIPAPSEDREELKHIGPERLN